MDEDDDLDVGWDDLKKPTYLFYSGLFVLTYETLTYPLDFLKTRQQYERTPVSVSQIASTVYKKEGIAGLFRGYTATMLGDLPGQVVYFGAYELAKQVVLDSLATQDEKGELQRISSTKRFVGNLLAGFAADVVCLLVHTPADVIAQRHMIATTDTSSALLNTVRAASRTASSGGDTTAKTSPTTATSAAAKATETAPSTASNTTTSVAKPTPRASSLVSTSLYAHQGSSGVNVKGIPSVSSPAAGWIAAKDTAQAFKSALQPSEPLPSTRDLIREIMHHEGLPGFYRGYWASVATFAPSSAIWFAVYELCKFKFAAWWPMQSAEAATTNHLVSGAIAGFAATVVMNPFDVAKTRLQTLNTSVPSDAELLRRGFFSLIAWTAKHEGLAALMKGIVPRLWFSVPGSAVTFAGYEWAKLLARRTDGEEE
eukprot:m.53126 g.53126  ORF g.53126 m.53126 type:complete len:427 (+) comp12765_c0_seq1:226-1506(+)